MGKWTVAVVFNTLQYKISSLTSSVCTDRTKTKSCDHDETSTDLSSCIENMGETLISCITCYLMSVDISNCAS